MYNYSYKLIHELLTLCLLTYLCTHVANKDSGHWAHEWSEVVTELSHAYVV